MNFNRNGIIIAFATLGGLDKRWDSKVNTKYFIQTFIAGVTMFTSMFIVCGFSILSVLSFMIIVVGAVADINFIHTIVESLRGNTFFEISMMWGILLSMASIIAGMWLGIGKSYKWIKLKTPSHVYIVGELKE